MSKRQQPKDWAKYSGIGFQLMIVTIGLIFLGVKADEWMEQEYTFVLIAIFAALFIVIYTIIKKLK